MKLGVYIENGPQDWQIIQHTDGKADIVLSGCKYDAGNPPGIVYVRVMEEDTGRIVQPWQKCEILSGNKWQTILHSIPAGGLYRVETCLNHDKEARMEWSTRGDMIHHLGIGDIFIIAGQSNSAGYGKDPVADPLEMGVHLLRNNGNWDIATHPMNESTGTIHEENRENANPAHSPYLMFAKTLKKHLGYPIGLVQAARGGSKLSEWNPSEDGVLYRNMLSITSKIQHQIKGILWYQGCGDTTEPECSSYSDRFQLFVEAVRRDYGINLPLLTVQINRATDEEKSDASWGKVKEAQRMAAKCIQNVFVVPSSDLPLCDRIHISSAGNMILGERLAASALRNLYGVEYGYEPPNIASAVITNENTIELVFDNVYGRLFVNEMAVFDLAIEVTDTNGLVPMTDYKIDTRNILMLKLGRIPRGDCFISGASGQYPCRGIPIDTGSYLPMLSFFRIKAIKLNSYDNQHRGEID